MLILMNLVSMEKQFQIHMEKLSLGLILMIQKIQLLKYGNGELKIKEHS